MRPAKTGAHSNRALLRLLFLTLSLTAPLPLILRQPLQGQTQPEVEAREAYRILVGEMPGDPWLKLEYAELLMGLGRWGEARTVRAQVASGENQDVAIQADAGLVGLPGP
jgi:hypothetical protein